MLSAAQLALAKQRTRVHEEMLAELIDLETTLDGEAQPGHVMGRVILRSIISLYEGGWQPADIAHTVKRQTNAKAHRLVIAMIANDARRGDAVHRAPELWLEQLEDLGAYDPGRSAIVGGHDDPLGGWARAEKMFIDEKLTTGLELIGQLLMSPRQPLLVDPPSKWPASNRGSVPQPTVRAGVVDAKALKLIRALLAKAEATTFEAEAESFTAKAQEMMTRYSIDAAVLASSARTDGGASGAPGVVSRRVHIDAPYADEKATFLAVIADVNGANAIWSPQVGVSTITGFPVDLQLTDLLFTSLLVQAQRSSSDATSTDRRLRTPSFRRAFLVSFAHRIGERLETTRGQASAEAAQQYGSALVPILADREAAVSAESTRLFPNTASMKRRSYNALGWHAGRNAADRAQIGHGEAITSG